MRTIKFRGKNSKGEWVVGDMFRNRGETFIAPDEIVNPLATADDFKVNPETVGQFTGLLDKNGKEIYEGDILGSLGKTIGHIVDGVRGYCYDVIYAKPLSNGEKRWSLYATVTEDYKGNIEVIGNIHDNPEPVKEK